jgi:hypothetical protein
MLVKCPECRIEFSPSLGCCPRCGVWQPAQEETDDYRIMRIQSALSDGRTTRQVRTELVSQGYDAEIASDLISEAKRRMKPAHRRLGVQMAFKGLLLMAISSVLYLLFLGILGIAWWSAVLAFYTVFAVGLALFIIGVIKGWTGWHIE